MSKARPTILTAAAVLLGLLSLLNLIGPALPSGDPLNGEGPPQIVEYLGVFFGILGLVAAYGLWQRKRWSMIGAVVTSFLMTLPTIPGIFFAGVAWLQVACFVATVIGIAIIVLVLMRQARAAYV